MNTLSYNELATINGGGWNEFGKALTGTAIVAGGAVNMADLLCLCE